MRHRGKIRTGRRGEQGITILAVLILAILVGGISSAFVTLGLSESRASEAWRQKMKATYLAEAGCEETAAQVRRLQANYVNVPTAPSRVTQSSTDAEFQFWKDTLGDLHGTGVLHLNGVDISCSIDEVGDSRTVSMGLGLRFLQAYRIVAETRFQGALGRVTRMVDLAEDPLPGFFAFYNSDLEIQPGPTANFTGRIHTNGNLHIGSHNTLSLRSSFVHASGEMYRFRKENGTIMGGTVRVTKYGTGSYADWPSSLQSISPDWETESANRWNGTVQAHVPTIEPPELGSIEPGGHFHQSAGLVIMDGQAYFNGSLVTLPEGTITTGSIYDAREEKNIPVTTVDVAKLGTSGYFPPNGILYAYHTSNSSSSPKGIMLTNGAELPAPLTTVSNAPVYIKGDFNTGGGNPARKRPAMVMADAINLLSNSWTGTKKKGDRPPAASNTTYNFVVVTGNLETQSGQYNGGLENLVRFHENWSNKYCTMRGSFINLWRSKIATGRWGKSNVYSPPNRNWDFDSSLEEYDNQPPGRLSGWSVARTTYQEDYP